MIIEISGLPENQKIKHINVDISFEEDNVQVKPCIKTSTEQKTIVSGSEHIHLGAIQNEINTGNTSVPDISKREVKEIPQEMRDMEF